jgi:hypothetical protein
MTVTAGLPASSLGVVKAGRATLVVTAGAPGAQECGRERILAPMRAPEPEQADYAHPKREHDDGPQDGYLFHVIPRTIASRYQSVEDG